MGGKETVTVLYHYTGLLKCNPGRNYSKFHGIDAPDAMSLSVNLSLPVLHSRPIPVWYYNAINCCQWLSYP